MPQHKDIHLRDPFVLPCNGVYYLYGSRALPHGVWEAGLTCIAALIWKIGKGRFPSLSMTVFLGRIGTAGARGAGLARQILHVCQLQKRVCSPGHRRVGGRYADGAV